MVFANNEGGPHKEEVGLDQLLQPERMPYGLCDWADAILDSDNLGVDRSGETRIMQDAEWWAPDDSARYKLTRSDNYAGKAAAPTRTYHLRVYTGTSKSSFTGYRYSTDRHRATKCDASWKNQPISHAGQACDEMLQHLRTAGVDPGESYLTPFCVDNVLDEIEQKDFSLRYKVGRIVGRLLRHEAGS